MRLDSLAKHDDRTAKAILAAAAMSQDGTPYYPHSAGRYDAEVAEVLSEIEDRLSLSRDDKEYDKKLRSFLSKQVVSAIMGESDGAEVRRRLGRQGRLPISAYKISFSNDFSKQSQEKEKNIRKAVLSAEDYQHLQTPWAPEGRAQGVTLLMVHQRSAGRKAHWLILDALRDDDRLMIDRCFRVFPDIVDLSQAVAPLDVLKAFVDHYGALFTIEDSKPSKMFENLIFPKPKENLKIEGAENARPKPGESLDYEISVSGSSYAVDAEEALKLGVSPVGCSVVLAYGVNMSMYLRDKRINGW